MKEKTEARQTVWLSAGKAFATRAARGTRIAVEAGVAWLTVERDARDFLLVPGETFVCEADGAHVVVEMLAPGSVAISSPQQGTALRAHGHAWIDRLRHAFRPIPLSLSHS